MNILPFEEISKGLQVLYRKDNNIYATKVIETTHGHPSIPMIRLHGGFTILYGSRNKALYADSTVNRTELLLNSQNIITDLNTE